MNHSTSGFFRLTMFRQNPTRLAAVRRTIAAWPDRRSQACLMITVVAASFAAHCAAQSPPLALEFSANTETFLGGQEMLPLKLIVVDDEGQPVANARITPWALRSSIGHGSWEANLKVIGIEPRDVSTNENGLATVFYPKYHVWQEQIKTTAVSLFVDHPEFAYVSDLHIDIPLPDTQPHKVELQRGAQLEIRPLIDDVPVDLDNLFAIWSDGRCWSGHEPQKLPDGGLRIPAMPLGKNSLLLAVLDGDRVTHFTNITDFELTSDETFLLTPSLKPSRRVDGKLSDNVPRPIHNGRIVASTLNPSTLDSDRIRWTTWTPIRADGTFTIEGWPADEKLQLIAICDGYIADWGDAPGEVENHVKTRQLNPQVFDTDGQIEMQMTPLIPCVVTILDEDDQPVANTKVISSPNVKWWNGGSQIYCDQLVRGERLLRIHNYQDCIDEAYPQPFSATTDGDGKAALELPVGERGLNVGSEIYEQPVFLGRREVKVEMVPGETTEVTLHVQPQGTEKLGDWDKLAVVVFGCSTRDGRRICALPEVRKKMDKFAEMFREGKSQRDPKLLAEAYSVVADAFDGVGDQEEAAKWREKAVEQNAQIEK